MGDFVSGYGQAAQNTYNQVLTYTTSLLIAGTVVPLSLLSMEAFGVAKGIDQLRPSYYMIKIFADNSYGIMWCGSFLYTTAVNVVVNFKNIVTSFLEKLMPFLKPYIKQLSDASGYVEAAVCNNFKAPLIGLSDGIKSSMEYFKRNVNTSVVVGALGLASLAAYYFWK